MEQHTKEKLEGTCGEKEIIASRAKRGKGTSAPTPEELGLYELFFKKAIKNKKKTKTLVLGGTPELRDLAIKYNSETIAVDISPRLLLALTNVMQHKEDFNNKYMIGDWLELYYFLKKHSFDVILADLSLNNVPYNLYNKMFRIINYLLKKEGYFITRHLVYSNFNQNKSKESIVDEFNKGKNSCLGLLLELGMYTEIRKKAFNPKTKEMDWSYLYKDYNKYLIKHIKKEELPFFENMMMHAKSNKSIILLPEEFSKIAKRQFIVENISTVKEIGHSKLAPVYSFRAKRKFFSNFFLKLKTLSY
jgi:ubiquinone/menaquinone biosynthesis C-methylase UbiE